MKRVGSLLTCAILLATVLPEAARASRGAPPDPESAATVAELISMTVLAGGLVGLAIAGLFRRRKN